MSLIRWKPYGSFFNVNRELENFFDDFGFPLTRRQDAESAGGAMWLPEVDLEENKDGYILKADLPGVAKEDVKITVDDNVLTVAGEKKFEKQSQENNYHRTERTYGSFSRSFSLPGPVNVDKIKAEYQNGVLRLDIPKAESAKPRQIEIH